MRKKLKVNSEYLLASGCKVKIICKYRNKEGKRRFIGEDLKYSKFYKFDKTGMPLGAPNSQVYSKIK